MNLSIKNAFVVYNYNTPLEVASLRGITLNVKDRDRISIIGNNANGKSTLLHMIAGHIHPTFGKIYLNKDDITTTSATERPFYYISQLHSDNCCDELSVLENIIVALLPTDRDFSLTKAVTKEKLQVVHDYINKYDFIDLKNVLHCQTAQISRIHRCALALLIASIKSPEILLVDNITSGLEPPMAERLITTMESIVEDKKLTLLAVMENPKQAFDFFNRGLIISDGRIVLDVIGDSKKRLDFAKVFDGFDITPSIKQFEYKNNDTL